MSPRPRGQAREPILRPAQGRYLRALLSPRDPLLVELERAGGPEHRDPATVRLIEILAAVLQPERVLDLACGTGEAALAALRGAPRARLLAVEPRGELAAAARATFARGTVADRVELVEEEELAVAARVEGSFGLVLFDASRPTSRRLLDLVLPRLAVRGLLIADRCLAGGRLADPAPADLEDPRRRELELFNPYLAIHPQMRSVLLPIGEGVALASKSKPLVLELGGPY